MIRAAVVGGAGYIGGEVVRLLLGHPEVELATVTSRSFADRPVDGVHPNLRKRTELRFTAPEKLDDSYDVLFLSGAHRETMRGIRQFLDRAEVVIDLSGDFRLRSTKTYEEYYGVPHEAADLIESFVTGLPELHRDALRSAARISVPGCMATAGILTVHPLAAAGLIDGEVTIDARTGSSGSGATAGAANLHAERSGSLRVFAPTRHRHEAEVQQATGVRARMTATGVEAVRGVQVLCRVQLTAAADERAVRAAYRACYRDEPFVRVVAERRGIHRLPDPKLLTGSNFCDVGFALEPGSPHALLIGALDNLVKGGAGNAVQAMNIRFGRPEDLGLEFTGLHPH